MNDGLLELLRWDYLRVFAETGLSPEWAERRTRESEDQVPMPDGFEHLRLAPSPIAGMGLFTDKLIRAGDVLGPARIAGKRTPLGRYANHSPWPNTEFLPLENGDLDSIALHDIPAGSEILNDYRQGARLWGASFDARKVQETLATRSVQLSAIANATDRKAK